MSAECRKHGCDIVYPEGSWPVGVCPECELSEVIAGLVWVAKRNGLASDPYVIRAEAILARAGGDG